VDASGRALVTGGHHFFELPHQHWSVQPAFGGNSDAFIAKLDTTKSGTASLLFSTYLVGSGEDEGSAIALDAGGLWALCDR